jgi:hypothetical protein
MMRSMSSCGASSPSRIVGEAPELCREFAFGFVGPERDDEQDRQSPQVARDVTQELTAGGVDPVHVVEHDDELSLGADVAEQLDDRLEQELLAAFVGVVQCLVERDRREQARELRTHTSGEAVGRLWLVLQEPPERIGPGRVGDVFDAAAARDQHVGDAAGELLEETGLADPGFAADQHQRALRWVHAAERGPQVAQGFLATN